MFMDMTLDQFLRVLAKEENEHLRNRFTDVLLSVILQLNRMEEMLMATQTGLGRVQADTATLTAQGAATQAAITALMQAMADADARLEADIQALRNNSGSSDEAALNAVADSLEQTQANLQSAVKALGDSVTQQQGVDAGLTLSPSTASLAPGGTQQFTASQPSTFKATSGSVDANGLYTAPADPTITSDTVTATISDGTGKTATANVTISATPAPAGGGAGTASAAPAVTRGIK